MDAAPAAPPPPAPPAADPRRLDLTLDALKRALADPGDHRLFRSGKLPGLFPSRTGPAADAAFAALADGLLETVRTEAKGKVVTEWVRATPKAVAFVHDRDSPQAVLRELREVLGDTRAGVPAWMADARQEIAAVADRFDAQAAELLRRLDALAERVDAALRRAELGDPGVPDAVSAVVPWAADALAHLDRRKAAGAAAECPLAELFSAVRDARPGLTLPNFHAGLRRLHDVRAVRLLASSPADADPEFALLVGADVCSAVSR